eukprot:280327-Pyramimonas_sp.AAC.1
MESISSHTTADLGEGPEEQSSVLAESSEVSLRWSPFADAAEAYESTMPCSLAIDSFCVSTRP